MPQGCSGPSAKIHDTAQRISAGETCFFQLEKIDGRRVQTSLKETAGKHPMPGFAARPAIASHSVPTEPCLLTIEGYDRDECDLFGHIFGMFCVRGQVAVTPKNGGEYFVRGSASEYSIAARVEDGSGRRISDVIRKTIPPPPSPSPVNFPNTTPVYYVDSPHPNDP